MIIMSILELNSLSGATYTPVQPVQKVAEVQQKPVEETTEVEVEERKPLVPPEKAFDYYEASEEGTEFSLAEEGKKLAEEAVNQITDQLQDEFTADKLSIEVNGTTFSPWTTDSTHTTPVADPVVSMAQEQIQTVGVDTAEMVANTLTTHVEYQSDAMERTESPDMIREQVAEYQQENLQIEPSPDPRPTTVLEDFLDNPTYQQNTMELFNTLEATASDYDPQPSTPPPGVEEINLADQFSREVPGPRETVMSDTPVQQKAAETFEKQVNDKLQVAAREQSKRSATGGESPLDVVETQPQVQEAVANQAKPVVVEPTVDTSVQPSQDTTVSVVSETSGASERADVSRETAVAPERIQPQTAVETETTVEVEPLLMGENTQSVEVEPQTTATTEDASFTLPEYEMELPEEAEARPAEDYFPDLPGTTAQETETTVDDSNVANQTNQQTVDNQVAQTIQATQTTAPEVEFAPLPGNGETSGADVLAENPVFNGERSTVDMDREPIELPEPTLQDFLGEGVSVISQQDMAFFRTTATAVQVEQLDLQFSANDDSENLFETVDPQTEEWYNDALNQSTTGEYGVSLEGNIDLSELEINIRQNREDSIETETTVEKAYTKEVESQVVVDREDTSDEAKEITTYFGVDT